MGRLSVSPDGKQLYAIVSNGDSGGVQRGGVRVFDIDASHDSDDEDRPITGLQPNFSNFLNPTTFLDPYTVAYWGESSDAPRGIAVSPDNDRVYLVQ